MYVTAAAAMVAVVLTATHPAQSKVVYNLVNVVIVKSFVTNVRAVEHTADSSAPRLSGEVLTAKNVLVHASNPCPGPLGGIAANFTATGAATGPYVGAFSATGNWSYAPSSPLHVWSFDESFTITFGVSRKTVSGTIRGGGAGPPMSIGCRNFGPADQDDGLTYSSGSLSGIATTYIRAGALSENLL